MIHVSNVRRSYGSTVAVDNISFTIPRGQIVGLLGHNGAGKSTTLKMLTGCLEPCAGTIDLANARIGYLPENTPLYPEMSIYEHLAFAAELQGIPEEQQAAAIRAAMEKTKLTERAHDLIGTLSKGWKQRVGVAQAIIHQPDLVIMDEPTNGLDPTQILEMRNLIRELSAQATVILSTHILQEVEAICDRVIIIMQGKIVQDASLAELQISNRVVVELAEESLDAALAKVPELTAVHVLGPGKHGTRYALHTASDAAQATPGIARAIIERGWPLFHIAAEQQDLESIFNDVGGEHG